MQEALAVLGILVGILILLAVVMSYYFGALEFFEYLEQKFGDWRAKR